MLCKEILKCVLIDAIFLKITSCVLKKLFLFWSAKKKKLRVVFLFSITFLLTLGTRTLPEGRPGG